jgi:hypothetical protein
LKFHCLLKECKFKRYRPLLQMEWKGGEEEEEEEEEYTCFKKS